MKHRTSIRQSKKIKREKKKVGIKDMGSKGLEDLTNFCCNFFKSLRKISADTKRDSLPGMKYYF